MHLIGYLFVFGCVRANTFVNDLQRRLYYESMIDLDTVIFLMEVNQMNESECKELVKDVVLPMRNFLVNIFSRKRGGSRLIDKKTRDRGWTDDEDESDETRGKTELDTKDIQTIKNNFKNNEKNKKGKKNDDGMDLGETLMDILRATSNFSLNVKTKYGKIDKSLEKRNKLFEFDRSQIAKSLFNTSHQKLLKDVETFLRESSASGTNPKKDGIRTFLSIKDANKKDTKYFQMIETIEKAVTETENIVKIKQREENEFTLVFGQQMKQEEVRVLKMSFNLGSTFLTPSIYLSISKALMIPEKSVFIEKMTNAMLKPILTLTNTNSIGADTEKKESILNFLRDVVSRTSSKYTDEIDGAFKARSTILDKFLRDDKDEVKERKMMQIDTVLEKRNKELLGKVESMRAEHFKDFLVLNQEIINVYIRFLNSNSANDRSKVNEYFNNSQMIRPLSTVLKHFKNFYPEQMTKGTSSFGKKNKHNHTFCIRCGKTSFNKQKRTCSACAYPAPKWKRPAGYKAKQRKNVNIRNRHMKRSLKSARSGFKGDPVMKAILSKYEVKN